jgi:hypothetical protein
VNNETTPFTNVHFEEQQLMTELQAKIRQYLDRISPPISGTESLRQLSEDLNRLALMIAEILEGDQRLMAPFNRVHEIMVESPTPATRQPDPGILVNGITVIDAIIDRLPIEGKNMWRRRVSLLPPIE